MTSIYSDSEREWIERRVKEIAMQTGRPAADRAVNGAGGADEDAAEAVAAAS